MTTDTKGCRILVSGIAGVDEEELKLFFESGRFCPNGGEVDHFLPLTDDEGVVIFKDSNVIKRLEGSLTMHNGRQLFVRPYEKQTWSAKSNEESVGRKYETNCSGRVSENSKPPVLNFRLSTHDNCETDCDFEENVNAIGTTSASQRNAKSAREFDRVDVIESREVVSECEQARCQSSWNLWEIRNSDSSRSNASSNRMERKLSKSYVNLNFEPRSNRSSNDFWRSGEKRLEEQRKTHEGAAEKQRSRIYGSDKNLPNKWNYADVMPPGLTVAEHSQQDRTFQNSSSFLNSKQREHQDKCKIEILSSRNLTFEKLQLLKMIWETKNILSPCGKCAVKFDEETCRVTMEGNCDNVDITKLFLLQSVSNFESEFVTISQADQTMLQTARGKEWLTNEFLQLQLLALFYLKDKRPFLIAKDETTLQCAVKHLQEIISSHTIPIENVHELFLQSPVWSQKVEEMTKSMLISVIKDDAWSTIEISGRKSDVEKTTSEIRCLLKKNVKKERVIKRHCGVIRLLAKNEKVIKNFIRECACAPVELIFQPRDAFIKITGLEDDVETAADVVANYSLDVLYDTVEINTPGLKKEMFDTKDSRQHDLIELLENRHECAIEVRNYRSRSEAVAPVRNLRPLSDARDIPATNIKVVSGSITEFKADVLVNTVADRSLERGGVVLRQFLEAGAPTLERELRKLRIPEKFGKDVAVTPAFGSIDAKFVLHAAIAKYRNQRSVQKLYNTIKLCLEMAMDKNATSIAFPTLGCGKLSFKPEDMIDCFLRAEKETKTNLKIFIVVFEEELLHKQIESYLQELISSEDNCRKREGKAMKFDPVKERWWKPIQTEEASKPTVGRLVSNAGTDSSLIVFHINAMNKEKLNDAKRDLIGKVNAMTGEEPIIDDVIAELDDEKLSTIKALENSNVRVEIDRRNCSILLKGERMAVYSARIIILTILASIRDIERYPGYWTMYRFPGSATQGVARTRRVPLDSSTPWYNEVSQVVMKTWEQQKVGQGFDAKGLGSHAIKIRHIFCNESPMLMDKYMAKRKLMSRAATAKQHHRLKGQNNEADISTMTMGLHNLYKTLNNDVNEVFLLHGTKSDALDVIDADGIDTRVCGENPLFGFGAYFAESSTKADQYADPKDQRVPLGQSMYMYLCRVLLGSTYVCSDPRNVESFTRPPCMQQGCHSDKCKHTARYDSVVGTHRPDPRWNGRLHFREFIVYHPDQSYPDFLVEYQRVKYP